MKILFATDGSPEAERARQFLGGLPLVPGTELLIVSVAPQSTRVESGSHGEEIERIWVASNEISDAREVAERTAYQLASAGVSTESLVTGGDPADTICRLAEKHRVGLIVMGARGHSALARFFLGSVSYRVARHARCPVLIVRPPGDSVRKVLLGVDGSEDARVAVRFLRTLSLPREITVILVYAVHVPVPFHGMAEGPFEAGELGDAMNRLRAAGDAEGKRVLSEAGELLGACYRLEKRLVAGPPARRLVELAGSESPDLVVVGSRGLTGVERFVMGSVSLQLCLHAPCSVLVVREGRSA